MLPVLPPAIDSDSEQMLSTTQKRLFLRETKIPVFQRQRPGRVLSAASFHTLAGLSGGAGLAVLILLSPTLPSLSLFILSAFCQRSKAA